MDNNELILHTTGAMEASSGKRKADTKLRITDVRADTWEERSLEWSDWGHEP